MNKEILNMNTQKQIKPFYNEIISSKYFLINIFS